MAQTNLWRHAGELLGHTMLRTGNNWGFAGDKSWQIKLLSMIYNPGQTTNTLCHLAQGRCGERHGQEARCVHTYTPMHNATWPQVTHTHCTTSHTYIDTLVPCPDTGSQMDTYMQCGTHTPTCCIQTHMGASRQTVKRIKHRPTQKWPQRNMECFWVQAWSPATATQRHM